MDRPGSTPGGGGPCPCPFLPCTFLCVRLPFPVPGKWRGPFQEKTGANDD